MRAFKVLEPGPLTTVQDLGRFGYQRFGIPVSGALDRFSCRVANLLLGNPETAAVLEIAYGGVEIEVLALGDMAICGADMPLTVNGNPQPSWASFQVTRGDKVSLGPAQKGLRAYLAVTGGIEVPEVMGSRSTYIGAKLGGHAGRALVVGDVLQRGDGTLLVEPRELPTESRPSLEPTWTLRALPGPQDDFFDEGLKVFFASEYKASVKSDRMGCRLKGPMVELKAGVPKSIISEPSLPGGVQIPADGQPIILLVEQTVGGYAKIATVITADLDAVAQVRPGDPVRFEAIDLPHAHRVFHEYQARLNHVRALVA